jgi:hypothetical protein
MAPVVGSRTTDFSRLKSRVISSGVVSTVSREAKLIWAVAVTEGNGSATVAPVASI